MLATLFIILNVYTLIPITTGCDDTSNDEHICAECQPNCLICLPYIKEANCSSCECQFVWWWYPTVGLLGVILICASLWVSVCCYYSRKDDTKQNPGVEGAGYHQENSLHRHSSLSQQTHIHLGKQHLRTKPPGIVFLSGGRADSIDNSSGRHDSIDLNQPMVITNTKNLHFSGEEDINSEIDISDDEETSVESDVHLKIVPNDQESSRQRNIKLTSESEDDTKQQAKDSYIEQSEYEIKVNKWSNIVGKLSIGLVTHCNMDKLSHLVTLCRNWDGVMSVAIYVECERDLNVIYSLFKKQLSKVGLIQIHVIFANQDQEIYPVDTLINIALLYCKCDHLFIMDVVECIPSKNLYQRILENVPKGNEVVVIPAFKLLREDGDDEGDDEGVYRMSKSELISKYEYGDVYPFNEEYTGLNYAKWMNTRDDGKYEMQYVDDFEPFLVIRNEDFAKRKTVDISELMEKHGFIMNVLNNGFVMKLRYKKRRHRRKNSRKSLRSTF